MNILNLPHKINETDDFKIIMITKPHTNISYTEYRVINKTNRYSTEEITKSIVKDITNYLNNFLSVGAV